MKGKTAHLAGAAGATELEDAAPLIGVERLPPGRFARGDGRIALRRKAQAQGVLPGDDPEPDGGRPAVAGLLLSPSADVQRSVTSRWRLLDRRVFPWVRLAVDLTLLLLVSAIVTASSSAMAETSPIGFYPLLPVALMAARGVYARQSSLSAVDAVVASFGAISIATMAYVTVTAFAGFEAGLPFIAKLWMLSAAVVCSAHAALILVRRWAHRTRRTGERALIVGAGVVGRSMARRLADHPEYGITPVGMVDIGPIPVTGDSSPPIVGAPHELVQVAEWMRADHVILAFPRTPDHELVRHIRRCEAAGLRVSLVPRLFESMNEKFEIQRVGAMPLLGLRSVDPLGWGFALKYQMDRFIAIALLVLMAPCFLLLAAGVRLSSSGPVFFRQRRIGLDGQVFDLLKFRSMYVSEGVEGFRPAPGRAPGGVEGMDRRTPFGRLLRRTFLDELPQLINVARGEMSLVGPRPERPEFVELFVEQVTGYADRHRAKSGITGWAQVHGLRGQTSVVERIELDNHYIDNWSLALDMKILLLTVAAVFTNRVHDPS